jgi:hypothetical protein
MSKTSDRPIAMLDNLETGVVDEPSLLARLSMANGVLPDILQNFQQSYPEIKLIWCGWISDRSLFMMSKCH